MYFISKIYKGFDVADRLYFLCILKMLKNRFPFDSYERGEYRLPSTCMSVMGDAVVTSQLSA